MQYQSLSQVQFDLTSDKISLPNLVRYYLNQIEEKENLNAFLSVYADEALAEAERIQAKISTKSAGRLAGMVIGIKDVLCYKDHPLQCASKILDGFESQFTATAVQKLLDEDAIIIGRLNCDEFAMGSSNENSAFGPTLNPIDNDRVPGGSSGASAAAVAADLCLAALGTDTGGSVRQPAAFCNIIGLKPTYSRVSRYGLAAYASSFDTIGTLTKSISDAALLLEIMAGHDEMDSTSSKKEIAKYSEFPETAEALRVGVITPNDQNGIDPEIIESLNVQVQILKSAGHKVDELTLPELDYALPTYYILTTAEASTNLSRYDGVRYGYRNENAHDLENLYKKSRSEGFGDEVQRRILLGTFVLSASYYDAYYTKAQKVRKLIQQKMKELFKNYDFLISPTTPTLPFKLGETVSPLEMYLADLFTVQASVAGIPAISIPVAQSEDGLPVGLQIMADFFREDKLLSFANYMQNGAIITK
ncbi:MAG: Asp-tRNA(Asn)/Glu-tRNA(Gln) amidotransferase subunit GatA [Cyclobacteriaceae bacterium]